LAHNRPPHERRNSVYLEKRNGSGTYLEEPRFDWALAVVRNYLYEAFKRVKLEAVAKSSIVPLAKISEKILQEQTYHLAHWQVWMKQLLHSTGHAFELGRVGEQMIQHHLIRDEQHIQQQWLNEVKVTLETVPNRPLAKRLGNGRVGEYTTDLEQALRVLGEVYVTDREAVW